MNEPDAALIQKRAELKQIINDGMHKTLPAYLYDRIGRTLVRIFHLKRLPHWSVSVLVLGLLVFLPGSLTAFVTKEIYHWKFIVWISHVTGLVLYLALPTAHLNVIHNILPGLRDHIVDSIESVGDLNRLENWLNSMWSSSRQLIFISWFCPIFAVSILLFMSNVVGRSIGIGFAITVLLVSASVSSALYFVQWMLTFPSELADYQLTMFESDPANSEIIQRLIQILNIHMYVLAGYFAVGTLLAGLISELTFGIWYFIVLGWIPTVLQFLANQYAIRKLIIRAKWRNLNRLQAQIKELQSASLLSAPDATITRLNQLMDLHDRISARPNSMLTWGTGLSFLNQLLLPLLGWFLGNLEKLVRLVTGNP